MRPEPGRPARHALRARPGEVRRALGRLRPALARLSPPGEDPELAEIVLAEVLNNIVEHAGGPRGGARVAVALWPAAAGILCRVRDDGRPLPGHDLPAAAPPVPASLPEGGFGWVLIRGLTRDLAYRRRRGRNELVFTIPVTAGPAADPVRPRTEMVQ
jgi:serine/threonine-protein kinase RsbW